MTIPGSEPIICPRCQAANPAVARFCMQCGAALAPPLSGDGRLARLTAAAPAPLATKLRVANRLAGERRPVTALFVDVVNGQELCRKMSAATWSAVMTRALDRFSPTIYRYEGTIARLMGDALLAFFGAPVAHEDDPLRAVRAALELAAVARAYGQEVGQEHGVTFAVQICLSSGLVVVGPVGNDFTYEYNDSNDAVNLTTLMKMVAPPMAVTISEDTHRFVEPFFDCAELGTIEVAGRSDPAHIYEVRGPRAEPGPARGLAGLESPLVGRSAELNALLQLSTALQAGLGRAAVVLGEPGMGKTRLIAEWKAASTAIGDWRLEMSEQRQTPIHWIEGRCLSYGQDLAYHLLVALLRSLLDIPPTAEEAEACAALLGLTNDLFAARALDIYAPLGHMLAMHLEDAALERLSLNNPQALRTQYLMALRELLQALAQRHPLIVVLEDMHWADPSSTDLLIKLLPLANELPLLFCILSRLDRDAPGWRLVAAAREMIGGGLTKLTLNALSDAESQQLVANLLEIEALPRRTRDLILKKTEGNPLFVEEVIRMLIERGAIVQRGERWAVGTNIAQIEIPDNLQGLLQARIDRLPAEVRHTLRIAAVIGRQFPLKVLEYVLQKEAGNDAANPS